MNDLERNVVDAVRKWDSELRGHVFYQDSKEARMRSAIRALDDAEHNAADAARAASPRVSDGEAGRMARAASTATVAGTSEARVREIAKEEAESRWLEHWRSMYARLAALDARVGAAEQNDIKGYGWHNARLNALEAAAKPRPSFNPKPLHPPPPAFGSEPTCTGCRDRIADSDYHSCVPSEPGSDETVPQKMGRGAPSMALEMARAEIARFLPGEPCEASAHVIAVALLASEAEVERLKAKWHEYDEASGLDYDDFDGDDAAWDEHVERAHAAYHAMKAAAIAPPPGAPTP